MEPLKFILFLFVSGIYAQEDQLFFTWDAEVGCSFLNKTVNTVVIFDYFDHMSAYFNGETTEVFVLSLEENSGVYFTGKESDKAWNAKKQTYDEYEETVNLRDLWATGYKEGVQFDAVTLPDGIQRSLSSILISQSKDYTSECAAYSYGLQITQKTFTHAIPGFDKVFKDAQAHFPGDVQFYQGVIYGIRTFTLPFGENIEVFKKKHVELDIVHILSTKSGSEALVYLLTQTSEGFNLEKVLGKKFESLSWTFGLISSLSGDSLFCYDGFLRVVSFLVRYASEEISEEDLRFALTVYFTSKRAEKTEYKKKWMGSVEELQEGLKALKLDKKFKVFSQALKSIQDNKWVIGKVDLSKVIEVVIQAEFNEASVEKVMSAVQEG